ncbi:hypothetical protein IPN35_02005 [Candidatus Peregrinibacteria bacterium]|nr:MAG: hypothetical protein IPN35_02005 [Candidatus Peregrinibacteria bacterium]
MIRYYNGGFDHWKLLRLTYRQFLMYYACLMTMLEAEKGKTPKEKREPESVMQDIKKTFNP